MKLFKKNKMKPKLIVSENVYNKMFALVDSFNKELSWHGFISKSIKEPDTYIWYDIIMFPQYNTGATSQTDEDVYSAWLDRQATFNNFKDMRLHGHSHVNMAVTPSQTDLNYRTNLVTNLSTFYFFIIVNKRREYSIALYDAEKGIIFENDEIEVVFESKAKEWAVEAIKNNIKENKCICSTIPNQKNSSTPKHYTNPYTSLGAEHWEDPLQSFSRDWD